MLDLSFSKPSEVVRRLCERLRVERLTLQLTQAEVAARAGTATNTVSSLESGRSVGFENLVRIAMVLGRGKELEALFLPTLKSLDDLLRYEQGANCQRIRSKRDTTMPIVDEARALTADSTAEILEVLHEAKILARRFYRLTGKPLGITGEVAEYEAATKLGLNLHCARQAGYDATAIRNGKEVRIQIKGRCVTDQSKLTGRLGGIDLVKPFDVVLLVLLDLDFNAFAMYESSRDAVISALTKPGSKARNERGALGIRQFIAISDCHWERFKS